MSGWVFLGWSSTKQELMILAQGHNTVTPVTLEPATPRSQVKHSTTVLPFVEMWILTSFSHKGNTFIIAMFDQPFLAFCHVLAFP